MTTRPACGLMVVLCLGSLAVAASQQQETLAPANSSAQTPASPSPQTDSPAEQSQNSSTDKLPAESKTQPHTAPTKKQPSTTAPNPSSHHRARAKRATVPESPGTPTKIVVREGGAAEPLAQIVTGMTLEEAARERREAELLLSTTAETLKEIAPRPLDERQEETVSQIHNYMEGARAALKEGDIPRAHTLAQKASLLADDLVKH
jgi:hypothetical protein